MRRDSRWVRRPQLVGREPRTGSARDVVLSGPIGSVRRLAVGSSGQEAPVTKVIVTGGTGKLGRAVLADLVAHGYEVLNIDQRIPRDPIAPTVRVDLRDFGEVVAA